jgi:deoxyadenosine/deoxycytidine kinase
VEPTGAVVTIGGNIATGKTQLVRALGRTLSLPTFEESWQLNPWFESAQRFACQTWFLVAAAGDNARMGGGGIQERSIHEHVVVFARAQLRGPELDLIEQVYGVLAEGLPDPALMIYLHAQPATLLARIRARARPQEASVTLSYLEELHTRYSSFITEWSRSPVLHVDTENVDLRIQTNVDAVLSSALETLANR